MRAEIIGRICRKFPRASFITLCNWNLSLDQGGAISHLDSHTENHSSLRSEIARRIDHTLLKAEAGAADIRRLVSEAFEHRFAAVCVNPRWAHLASETAAELAATRGRPLEELPAVAGCVGFPLGAGRLTIKAVEASSCVKDGCNEIDMVMFIPLLLAGDLPAAREEVMEVVRAARSVWNKTVVKVILETAVLNEHQIALGCEAAISGGADFVKTSTGFHPAGGATVEAVRLLKKHAGPLKVKASGGIRTAKDAMAMMGAGADRIGCSASLEILRQAGEQII